jgi:hypothetical protein
LTPAWQLKSSVTSKLPAWSEPEWPRGLDLLIDREIQVPTTVCGWSMPQLRSVNVRSGTPAAGNSRLASTRGLSMSPIAG